MGIGAEDNIGAGLRLIRGNESPFIVGSKGCSRVGLRRSGRGSEKTLFRLSTGARRGCCKDGDLRPCLPDGRPVGPISESVFGISHSTC